MPVSHVLTKEPVEMRGIVIVLMTFTKMTVLVRWQNLSLNNLDFLKILICIQIVYCKNDTTCSNQGNCGNDGTCECLDGFYGNNCTSKL